MGARGGAQRRGWVRGVCAKKWAKRRGWEGRVRKGRPRRGGSGGVGAEVWVQRGGCRGVGAEPWWVQRGGCRGVGAKDAFSANLITSRKAKKQKH